MNNRDPREIAVRVLQRRESSSDYTEELLAGELAGANLAPADRGLAQEITYGAVRWQAPLDWLIDRKTRPGNQKSIVRILLRLGLYQLFWLERIPDHAAVHETVALAKRLGFARESGFINAILRGFLREREATERLLMELRTQQPALACSHPDWLFCRWEKRWGLEKTLQLMDWNNHAPGTFARVNTLRIQPEQLVEQWTAEGVAFEPVVKDWISDGLIFKLNSHPRLDDLPSFQRGFFYIQDPSTLLAVHQLAPAPNETVLDLCAAPGGKTAYIAQWMGNQGRIVAQDLSPHRLKMVQENCERLGIACVEPKVTPETSAPPEAVGTFDRVLLDAPCSNTGVMRRRVDLRWRVRLSELERLRSAQLHLLDQAAADLKPGGVLVYSTCSLEPEENRQVIDQFLGGHAEFGLESERELLPFVDGVDGAYVARLVRSVV